MIDVFILDFDAGNKLRAAMSVVCKERWRMEPGCRVTSFSSKEKTFHIDAKRMAEETAASPIYVVADNDCLILGENFVKSGVEIMERHQEYGLLAATSICDGEYSNGSYRQVNAEVVQRHAVGGVAFVRKGILTEFNLCIPSQVDETICHEIKSKGHRTGSMPWIRFNHIGAGYSLSSPIWWMKVPT